MPAALSRIATIRSFREYVLGLTFQIKTRSLLGMVKTHRDFLKEESMSELHVSTISDASTLLHYVRVDGEMHRGVQVLKIRGSDHDKAVWGSRSPTRACKSVSLFTTFPAFSHEKRLACCPVALCAQRGSVLERTIRSPRHPIFRLKTGTGGNSVLADPVLRARTPLGAWRQWVLIVS